jgi:hypothetical protein
MNSFIDGSSLLASSSASSSDNPTEGHFVPGKASDIITPANTNIVLDEVMQSRAGGRIDQSSSATLKFQKHACLLSQFRLLINLSRQPRCRLGLLANRSPEE